MARQKNDGKGRLGGRAKGTPNKVTTNIKDWIVQVIDNNKQQMERDLKALSPKDRLAMLEKLMQYVVPKQKTEMEIKQIQENNNKKDEAEFDLSCVPKDLIMEVANYLLDAQYKKMANYNPQNEMFRRFRTKCSISQNEAYLRKSFFPSHKPNKKHRKNLLLRCFFANLFGYLAKNH